MKIFFNLPIFWEISSNSLWTASKSPPYIFFKMHQYEKYEKYERKKKQSMSERSQA